jgi:hypothetical protein
VAKPIAMWSENSIKFCQRVKFILILSAVFAIGVPEEMVLSQTGAECSPKYEECIGSCGKQNNSCYAGAGTDTDQIARCDDQYTACNEKCFTKFCWKVNEEKSE